MTYLSYGRSSVSGLRSGSFLEFCPTTWYYNTLVQQTSDLLGVCFFIASVWGVYSRLEGFKSVKRVKKGQERELGQKLLEVALR
jgi:hypothetical protein